MDTIHWLLLWTWWLLWDHLLPAPEAPSFDGLALESMTQEMKAEQVRWCINNSKKAKRHNERRYREWRRANNAEIRRATRSANKSV